MSEEAWLSCRDSESTLQVVGLRSQSKFVTRVQAAVAISPDRARKPVQTGNMQERQGKREWLFGVLSFCHKVTVTFVQHFQSKHGNVSDCHLLFQYINNICRHRCEEIHSNPRMPRFIIVVTITEIDPRFSNTSAAHICHGCKPIARNKESLALHAQIPVIS